MIPQSNGILLNQHVIVVVVAIVIVVVCGRTTTVAVTVAVIVTVAVVGGFTRKKNGMQSCAAGQSVTFNDITCIQVGQQQGQCGPGQYLR